jgi:uncharacterized protein GlcG (DUF336 family)
VKENTMLLRTKVLLSASVAAALMDPANAQVLTNRDISVHMALNMVNAALAECEGKGLSVSVVVLNNVGQVRAMAMGDRGRVHNVELAQRKAYTALTFRRPSSEWVERTGPDSRGAGQRALTGVIALPGGIPVKIGDETIGAVGVSGSALDTDEGCAKTAAASIADQLK